MNGFAIDVNFAEKMTLRQKYWIADFVVAIKEL